MVIGEHYSRTMTVFRKHEFKNRSKKNVWQIYMKDEDGKLYFTFTASKMLATRLLRNLDKPVQMSFLVCSHSSDWDADVIKDIIFG